MSRLAFAIMSSTVIAAAVAIVILIVQLDRSKSHTAYLETKASKIDKLCEAIRADAKRAFNDSSSTKAMIDYWIAHSFEIRLCLPQSTSDYEFGRALIEGPD